MMSRMLGAPLGGTTRGGHQGFEAVASSLMTPPNFMGGDGSCLPSSVIVASGEPGVPVICCAAAGATATVATSNTAPIFATTPVLFDARIMFRGSCFRHNIDEAFNDLVIGSTPWFARNSNTIAASRLAATHVLSQRE